MSVAILSAACGPRKVETRPVRPTPPTVIALLPDPETGTTGRIRVSDEFGGVDLDAPRTATRVTADRAPGAVTTMSEEDVRRVFGGALDALPPASRHFTLNFKFESDALTPDAVALVPQILTTVRNLSAPEVAIVGHTDTMGDRDANLALGLKRAMMVRNLLVDAGLTPTTIEVASHGEADLLVNTPDNTSEPRNRRVEITVR